MGREGHVFPLEIPPTRSGSGADSRKWILFNSSGQKFVLENVNKHAIMHRVQIHARDLRILDPLLSYPPTIMGRERAIVLNLEHIKAIISADEVLLRDLCDGNVIPVVMEFERRLPAQGQDESPFEFRALEVVLEAICSFLAACTTNLETAVYPALDELTSKISSRNLDRIRKLKSTMTRLNARAQKVRDELEQLLDDDADMASLYLSRKLSGFASPISSSGDVNLSSKSPTIGSKLCSKDDINDIEELEMLLEVYFMRIDTTLNKLTTLREYINDTEDYINIQLDSHRNQLIQLELFLSAGTVCLSIYALVTGIFGVNIPYYWTSGHSYLFKWVVIGTTMFCAVLFVLIMSYARYKGLVG